MSVSADELRARIEELHESNPMLGLRGCRLGDPYPEICDMQVRAIIEAAVPTVRARRAERLPEIMIPLVGNAEELRAACERRRSRSPPRRSSTRRLAYLGSAR